MQSVAIAAEKSEFKTYVLDGIVFNEKDDIKTNLDALVKLTAKRKQQKATCCNQELSFKQMYQHISQQHNNGKNFACSSCDYTSDAVTSVQHHYFHDHCRNKIFICPKCSKTFRDQSILTRHFKKCFTGTLARGSRGSNSDIKRSLNEKIASLNAEQKSNFKTNFNNFTNLMLLYRIVNKAIITAAFLKAAPTQMSMQKK